MTARTYTPEELSDLAPEELEALNAAGADTSAVSGASGDDDDGQGDGGSDDGNNGDAGDGTAADAAGDDAGKGAAANADAAKAGDGEGGTQTADQLDSVLEEFADDDADIGREIVDIKPVEDKLQAAQQKVSSLEDKLEEVDTKWAAGELSDEERTAQRADLRTQIRAAQTEERTIERDLISTNTLNQDKLQRIENAQVKILQKMAVEGKKQGIDYADPEKQLQFDTAMTMLSKSKTMAGKSFRELADAAHKSVLAVNGLLDNKKEDTKVDTTKTGQADAKPKEKKRDAPITLSGLPTAGSNHVSDDVVGQLGAIEDPDQAEAMYEGMSKARRATVFRSTVR